MSTTLAAVSLPAKAPLRPAAASAAVPSAHSTSIRGLSTLLLAAVLAALVVLADRFIDTWADGHLFLAWVALWAVVFAGLALFAGSVRHFARRATVALDNWSRSLAEARAEMRIWEMARHDPRLMNDLIAARTRADDDEAISTPAAVDVSDALAPVGSAIAEAPRNTYWERLADSRSRNAHLFYV